MSLTGIINATIEELGSADRGAEACAVGAATKAQQFYAEHKGRPFYDELCAFMTSGPIVVQVLEGESAIAKYRKVMGATEPVAGKKRYDPEALCPHDGPELGAWFRQCGLGDKRDRAQFRAQTKS